MRVKKTFGAIALSWCLLINPVFAEVIQLKSGKKIEGKIIEKTSEYIKLDVEGVTLTYYLDQIVNDTEQSKTGQASQSTQNQEGQNYINYVITQKHFIKATEDARFIKLSIATPRKDIFRQVIGDVEIFPKPNATFTDNDANEIVVFYNSLIKNGTTFIAGFRYNLKLDTTPFNIKPESIPDTYDSLDESTKKYLAAEGQVNPEEVSIKAEAARLTANIKNPYQKAKAIYDFITDNFKYDYDLLNQMQSNPNAYHSNPPPMTLIYKKGICYDFAKLYVALARSSGVPARVVRGIAFDLKDDQKRCVEDLGHAWVEVYLPVYGWVPVDPTFGLSRKNEYFCFVYKTHISQEYGLSETEDFGSLEKGWNLQYRTESANARCPVQSTMMAELLKE